VNPRCIDVLHFGVVGSFFLFSFPTSPKCYRVVLLLQTWSTYKCIIHWVCLQPLSFWTWLLDWQSGSSGAVPAKQAWTLGSSPQALVLSKKIEMLNLAYFIFNMMSSSSIHLPSDHIVSFFLRLNKTPF
jgi:hypothetical protein